MTDDLHGGRAGPGSGEGGPPHQQPAPHAASAAKHEPDMTMVPHEGANHPTRTLRLDQVTPYASYAVQHLSAGYSALPLPFGKKAPPPDGWTGRDAPMASRADVECWREDSPGANIAVRLPDGVIAIDVDDYDGKGGATTLGKAAAEWGELPATPSVTSRGATNLSRKLLFRVPTGRRFVGNLKALFGEGVDVLQPGHRYMLAPGSVHPEGGVVRAYRADGSALPEGCMPSVDSLAEMPEEWLEGLTAKESASPASAVPGEQYLALDERLRRRVDAYVARAVEEIQRELRDSAGWPVGKTDEDGRGWEKLQADAAWRSGRLARADWNGLTLQEAERAFLDAAPTDPKWSSYKRRAKWLYQHLRGEPAPWPAALDDNDPATWDDIPSDSGLPSASPVEKPKARTLPHPDTFFDARDRLESLSLARAVLAMGPLAVGRDGLFWEYAGGVWRLNDHVVRNRAVDLLCNRYRQGHVGIARDIAARLAPKIEADPVPDLINFTNGMLRWRTGDLEPHDPDLHSTVQLPVAWDPAAECPRFSAWLESMLEPEYVHLVWQVIGYCMVSGNPLQTAVLFLGSGANGKGVLLRVLTRLLGRENVSAVSLDDLTGNRFASSSLYGKSANVAGDIDATFQVNTAVFKKITGEDSLQAERKHRDAFDFTCWAVPVFSANKIPGSADVTLGYLRRWVIVEFTRTIRDDEKILGLSDQLAAEVPGIAVKAVAHLGVLDTGFAKVERGQERFASAIDQVRVWVADATVGMDGVDTPRTELYKAYRWWAEENGAGKLKSAEFYSRLEDLGFEQKKIHGGVRMFTGIATCSPATPAPAWDFS